MDNRKKLALIPAYMPDEALIEITKELHNRDFTVIVIDDGSQSEYDKVFNKAEEFAKVIRCKKNCRMIRQIVKKAMAASKGPPGIWFCIVDLLEDHRICRCVQEGLRDSPTPSSRLTSLGHRRKPAAVCCGWPSIMSVPSSSPIRRMLCDKFRFHQNDCILQKNRFMFFIS